MKAIFKSTMIMALGFVAFTACEDDNDSNPTIAQPTKFVLNEPAIVGNIDLEKTATIALTWSQPTPYTNFNTPVVPTYWVEMSPTGNFTKAFDANAEDNAGADYFTFDETYSNGMNVELNSQTLNRNLLQLQGWTETTTPAIQQVSVRVKSALRDASFNEYSVIYSNIVTLSTVPYYVELKPADPEIWWLIGADIADGSWGGDMGKCVIPMQTL
ncbi:MAG: SusE domain-containing protein, partial [Prevotella sp.]|nr:SusE domain-containing protein [Prevotella sp.]